MSQHSNASFEKSLQKAWKKFHFQSQFPNKEHTIWIHAWFCSVLPGLARFCPAERRPGAGIQGIPPHVPMSQSATRPLGRQLAYRIESQTLAGSHHIACKLHAITEDYHPPGRHQNRCFRVLQPFRAKTLIFMEKATFTSGAVLVHLNGSLLLGVSRKHGNSKKSP